MVRIRHSFFPFFCPVFLVGIRAWDSGLGFGFGFRVCRA